MALAGPTVDPGAPVFSPSAPSTKVATNTGGSPFSPTKGGVTLKPGQTLHYTAGKGYYAGAPVADAGQTPPTLPPNAFNPTPGGAGAVAPSSPAAPQSMFSPAVLAAITPMTGAQIAQDAQTTASGELSSAAAPILQAQQSTDAMNLAQQKQAQAFDLAGNDILKTLGPSVQQGYAQGAQELNGLAGGFNGTVGADLAAEQAASKATAATVGATGGNAPQLVNPGDFGNTLKMGTQFIPSSNLVAQGAAARAAATGEQAVNVDVARAEQQGLQATAQADNLKAAQQVATLAAKYPQWFTAQEHADIQQNLTKVTDAANIDKTVIAANAQQATAAYHTEQAAVAGMNAQTRALTQATNTAFDKWKTAHGNSQLQLQQAYDAARIKIQGTAANTAYQKLVQAGARVDKNSSLAYGHIVLMDGTVPQQKNGQVIPVSPTTFSSGSASSRKTPYMNAIAYAEKALGTPVVAPSIAQTVTGGKYILHSGLNPTGPQDHKGSGSYPSTTDDATRAQKSQTQDFGQMQTYVMGAYGISKSQARQALIDAGWKPASTPRKPYQGPLRIPPPVFAGG